MLAQNFKTPAELRLTNAEFDALFKVVGMLEREELVHADYASPTVPNGFNMNRTHVKGTCGTAACMMGWARVVARDGRLFERALYFDSNMPLAETFMFQNVEPTYYQDWPRAAVTPAQAAIALRNYLTHGEPRWAEALA